MKPIIYFDMDGTIANLYGVENWLDDLLAENPRPYAECKPLINFSVLARELNKMQRLGFEIGIITWLCKDATEDYDAVVTEAKKNWLKKHLPSVNFDEIHIAKYGTPKSSLATREGYLFDDELRNRLEWGENARGVENIIEELRKIRS